MLRDMIFVFGSNLTGRHEAGAALEAASRGFPRWLGSGYAARCYAIPTKDCEIRPLSLAVIEAYVMQFRSFAAANPQMQFQVTRIGCGLAGFKDENITPMFMAAPFNCHFDEKWKPWLEGYSPVKYWGTY